MWGVHPGCSYLGDTAVWLMRWMPTRAWQNGSRLGALDPLDCAIRGS